MKIRFSEAAKLYAENHEVVLRMRASFDEDAERLVEGVKESLAARAGLDGLKLNEKMTPGWRHWWLGNISWDYEPPYVYLPATPGPGQVSPQHLTLAGKWDQYKKFPDVFERLKGIPAGTGCHSLDIAEYGAAHFYVLGVDIREGDTVENVVSNQIFPFMKAIHDLWKANASKSRK